MFIAKNIAKMFFVFFLFFILKILKEQIEKQQSTTSSTIMKKLLSYLRVVMGGDLRLDVIVMEAAGGALLRRELSPVFGLETETRFSRAGNITRGNFYFSQKHEAMMVSNWDGRDLY